MLAAHDEAGSFLEAPVLEHTSPHFAMSEGPGSIIGTYKLLQKIGEGGFGIVFMAEQQAPVRRKVALKIIKPGMDTKEVIARFESERQALAMMDHTNIARVLDAGATKEGRPFFVMELVKGVPITEYCDKNNLPTLQRLELFTTVCRAVQHAHQKGIIHRDIKPSNIMITLHDGKPIPKVIDFGVAKATNQQLTERTLFTAYGQMIGTPAYMSPEQAEMSGLDVDTRSDIYSLGVLLYELLTGSTPFDGKALRQAGYAEMQRIICEQEPPKPSTRLTSLGEEATIVSSHRSTDLKRLAALIRGDLDWIVMKALAKERDRRYETSNSLANDVERFLQNEAITARPPSVRYKLRKLVQRNKGLMAAVATVAAVLVIGTAVATWQAVEATRAKEQAQKRLAQIEKGNEIITAIFTDLDLRAVKEGTNPLETVLAKRLVQAAEQLEGEAVGDSPVVAGLQNRLGLSLMSLGHPQAAIPLFVKARATQTKMLGADHPEILASMNNLALGYHDAGKLDQALKLFEETLKLRQTRLGTDHPDTLASMNNLAFGYRAAGKLDLALQLYEETLKLRKTRLGADHPDTLRSMNNLAAGYRFAGKLDLALPLLEETQQLMKVRLGADHPDTLASMNNLAEGYRVAGKLDLALPLLEETLRLRRAKLGADHPSTLANMNSLAASYLAAGKLDLALQLYEETLKGRRARLGAEHPDTLASMANLANIYWQLQRYPEALKLQEETLAARKRVLPPEHPDTLKTIHNLAISYKHMNRQVEALNLLEDLLPQVRRANPPLREQLRNCLYNLACIHSLKSAKREDKAKQADRSIEFLRQAVAAGWDNTEHAKQDKDLDPIRDREDFKKLIAELEAKK